MASAPYLVFISHSWKDRWIARQIAQLIEEKGIKTFLDEKDIQGGESIPDSVRKNIQECDELLVLMSPYSVDRPWVLIEVGAAWGLGRRVVPIIDKVSPDQMPDILAQHRAIDLNDSDDYLAQLVKRAEQANP